MDKYEYRVRSEEIVKMIELEKYEEAAQIADTIDWRRVKSMNMLLRVASLYRVNHRNEDSREILQLAFERYPTNRTVLYCLCEVSIELDDVVSAIEYYKEFVKQAPRDNGVFTLRYKILEAQEASLEERIEILEELKKRDYQEDWAYELAYLYHRVGLATKCVEECDDLILWFGDGPYVKKAMELKMLHAPLTGIQEKKYNIMQSSNSSIIDEEELTKEEPELNEEQDYILVEEEADYRHEEQDLIPVPVAVHVNEERPIQDLSQYNTINLQKVVAESMRELFPDDEDIYAANKKEVEDLEYASKKIAQENHQENIEEIKDDVQIEEEVQAEAVVDEIIQEDDEVEEITEIEETAESEDNRVREEDIYFSTEKIEIIESLPDEKQKISRVAQMTSDISEIKPDENAGAIKTVFVPEQKLEPVKPTEKDFMIKDPAIVGEEAAKQSLIENAEISRTGYIIEAETEKEEEQIPFRPMTGQMNIEDVLKEWERLKEENEQKRKDNIRELVIQQTGQIMASFDEAIRNMEKEEIEPIQEIAEYTSEELPVDEILDDSILNESDSNENISNEESINEDIISENVVNEETSNEVIAEDIEEAEEFKEVSDTEEAIEEIIEKSEEESEDIVNEEPEAELELVEDSDITEETKEESNVSMDTKEIENLSEKIEEATKKQTTDSAKPELRGFTDEEKGLFENFAVTKKIKKQIITALDNMTMSSYTGNIIITGEAGLGTLTLSKNILKTFKVIEPDFNGKTAKITGSELNDKNVSEVFEKLTNGCLIVDEANGMHEKTIFDLTRLLDQEDLKIVVILIDTKKGIQKLLNKQALISDYFNLRIDLVEMDNNALVSYAKSYALALEYSIDELGTLALHTRIEHIQSGNHIVTKDEVKEIVDEAIWKSKKSKVKNFVDILFAKRYDDQDMIVLRERDFM